MKRFEQLGRKLSMMEQKNVVGGVYNADGARACTTNDDCPTIHNYRCPNNPDGDTGDSHGICYNFKCRYAFVCAGDPS